MMKNFELAILALVAFWAAGFCDSKASTVAPKPASTVGAPRDKELTLDLGDKVTLKLVRIPAGKFVMGSPETEKDRYPDSFEVQHEVTISKPFYMGVTHVTVDQFAAFVKDSDYLTEAEKAGYSTGREIRDGLIVSSGVVKNMSWRNPDFEQKGDHPVVQVSWNDATAFCSWLSKKSGRAVVLPTEAQWEYACRAGTKTTYPWGDNPDNGKGWANCADQSLKKQVPNARADGTFFTWDDGFVYTSPVGSFKPNAFGLYDMTGNAWQWCQDLFKDADKRAVTDPTGATPETATGGRILRGGGWYGDPQHCRSAARDWFQPNECTNGLGFRVVVTAGGD